MSAYTDNNRISWIGIICPKQVPLCLQSPRERESQQLNEPRMPALLRKLSEPNFAGKRLEMQ